MMLTKVLFKREGSLLKEYGVMINEGLLIIDKDGKPVDGPLENYWLCYSEFSVNLDLTINPDFARK